MQNKKMLINLVQIVIAIGIVFFLCTKIDLHKVDNIIRQSSINYLLIALFFLIGQMTLAAYRWLLTMRANGFSLQVWPCIGSFAASSFINTTLPVSIGGDLLRIWAAKREGISTGMAVNNVLLDRILNTVSLASLVFMIQIPYIIHKNNPIHRYAFLLALASLIAFVGLSMIHSFLNRFNSRLIFILSPFNRLSQMTQQIIQLPNKNRIKYIIVLYTGHFISIVAALLIAKGLGMELSFNQAIMSFPIMMLFSAVPITPGGWGVREGVMILLLSPIGFSPEMALSVSILFGVGSIVSSIPATIIWAIQQCIYRKSIALVA